MCIVGLCNLILYIGYILYIVKSLCDINGYVFTIERERRTGHPRVYPTGDRPIRDVPWFFRGPASPSAARSCVFVMSSNDGARLLYVRNTSVSHRSEILFGADQSDCLVSNVHNIKFRIVSFHLLPSFVHLIRFIIARDLTKLLKRGVSTTKRRRGRAIAENRRASRYALPIRETRSNIQGRRRRRRETHEAYECRARDLVARDLGQSS